jgi:general secretion pathway protein K
MTPRRRPEAGFALLIVLWTMVLLALLGTQLLSSARSDSQLARNLVDAAEMRAATNGAIQQAIFHLLEPPPQRWAADGRPYVVRMGAAAVRLRIQDEGGKVNLNAASPTLLQALLVEVGEAPAQAASIAAAIVAWRSSATQPGGTAALATQYAAAGLDYRPRGSGFRSIGELGDVLGMTPELLARVRPHVTVYSDTDPNGSTSDPVVAAALGNPPASPQTDAIGPDVVSIVADARGPEGNRVGYAWVVRLNSQFGRFPYEVLSMQRITPEAPDSGR